MMPDGSKSQKSRGAGALLVLALAIGAAATAPSAALPTEPGVDEDASPVDVDRNGKATPGMTGRLIRAEAGPGQNVDLTFPGPDTVLYAAMILSTGRGQATFGHVASTTGASVTYAPDRRSATVAPLRPGDGIGTVKARIDIGIDARPSHVLAGTASAVDHRGELVRRDDFHVFVTTDGCFQSTSQYAPVGLLVWFRPVKLENSCHADIEVKVPFAGGPDSDWVTIGHRESHTFWSTPWAKPRPHLVGGVSPHPFA
jgi:hypothetical protein